MWFVLFVHLLIASVCRRATTEKPEPGPGRTWWRIIYRLLLLHLNAKPSSNPTTSSHRAFTSASSSHLRLAISSPSYHLSFPLHFLIRYLDLRLRRVSLVMFRVLGLIKDRSLQGQNASLSRKMQTLAATSLGSKMLTKILISSNLWLIMLYQQSFIRKIKYKND